MLGLYLLLQPRLSARSVAVPFSPYRLSYQGNIVAAVINHPLCLLAMSIQKCTDTHARTNNNTHDRMVGSRHTQARCGKRSKSKSLYLIAQQSGVECSAYFEHVRVRCFFLFVCLFVLSFYFQILLTSLLPFFLSMVGGQSQEEEKKERKKKMKSVGKKRGELKKILLNFLILEL